MVQLNIFSEAELEIASTEFDSRCKSFLCNVAKALHGDIVYTSSLHLSNLNTDFQTANNN